MLYSNLLSNKKAQTVLFNRMFESRLYRKKRYRSSCQLKSESQVEDVVVVLHFFACTSHRCQRRKAPFVRTGHSGASDSLSHVCADSDFDFVSFDNV